MERCQAGLAGQHPPAFQGSVLPSPFWAALRLQGRSVARKYPEGHHNLVCLHSPEENQVTKKSQKLPPRAFLGSAFTVQFCCSLILDKIHHEKEGGKNEGGSPGDAGD